MLATMNMPQDHHGMPVPPRAFPSCPSFLGRDLMVRESSRLFGLPERVVVVMDSSKEFSIKPLEWLLENVGLDACCTITLLGVKPWLNIPLSSKSWSDVWTSMDLEEILTSKDIGEWRTDARYIKAQSLVELCLKYGVVPQIKTETGFPQKLLLVEKISSSNPTLVVFDRHHHRKDIHFCAEKLPCNIIAMNNHGEAEWVRGPSNQEATPCPGPGLVTSCSIPTPKSMIPDYVKRILRLKARKTKV